MKYNIRQIGEILGGEFLNTTLVDSVVEHVQYDSRIIIHPENSLFLCIQGKNRDGHEYIEEVYALGVRHFLVSNRIEISNYPDANFMLVGNTLHAFQQLARNHRNKYDLEVIGITGSNGKTIIKEWLNLLLNDDCQIVRSPKSFNSQLGVPYSVLQIGDGDDLGIFEAGISETGEMSKLASIINCQIGIFSNIGSAHDKGFSNRAEKAKEKALLFNNTDIVIYCKDHPEVDKALQFLPDSKKISWSVKGAGDLVIQERLVENNGSILKCTFRDKEMDFSLPFQDSSSQENALHCITLMLHKGYSQDVINNRLQHLEQVALRLELKDGINDCQIINDSYNADLDSLKIALDFLDQQHRKSRKVVIVSDILQSGIDHSELYQQVAELMEQKTIDELFGVGKDIKKMKSFLSAKIKSKFFSGTGSLISYLERSRISDATILLKGARKYRFEKLSSILEKKAHKTVLEINLNSVSHNFNVYRQRLKPETKIMVMVKASAYGSGGHEIARLLEFLKVDYLAVAYADEGVELRQAGIHLPIMVLNPEQASFDSMVEYRLEPEIYSLSLAKEFSNTIQKHSLAETYPVHLKLDSGMKRLGFEVDDLPDLIKWLKAQKSLRVESIFSHLAASDNSEHDKFTHEQFQLFREMYEEVCKHLKYNPERHLLNSSGIARFPQYQLEMVRLGIGIYGIDSSYEMQAELEPVSSLKATLSQIKHVSMGDSIGYDRAELAKRETRTGTISIGYGDGFSRVLSKGIGSVMIRGKKAPVIGNVCMDMTIIDLTDIPEAKVGEEVEIFGLEKSISEFATEMGTIPYEVLTSISSRVKRVYFQD